MKRFLLGMFVAAALLLPVRVKAGELTQQLPSDTVAYLFLDTADLINQYQKAAEFIDPATGAEVVAQLQSTYAGAVKVLEESASFHPKLLDELHKTKGHLVVLRKAEPRIVTNTIKTPKMTEDGQWSSTEFNETTTQKEEWYTASFLLETTPDVADDFLTLLQNTVKDKPLTPVAFNGGRMLTDPEKKSVIGQIGNYLMVSNDVPKELGAALASAPAQSLAANPAYKPYAGGQVGMFVNLQALIRTVRQDMEAQAKAAQEAIGKSNDDPNAAAMQAMQSQMQMQAFEAFAKMFNLDQMLSTGGSATVMAGTNAVVTDSAFRLKFDGDLSPVMQALFNGGRPFAPPAAIHKADQMLIMGRVGFKELFAEMPKFLPPQIAMVYQMMMMQAQAQVGQTPDAIAGMLAGDMYMYMDMTESKLVMPNGMPTPMMPKYTIAIGVQDEAAFAPVLQKLMDLSLQQSNGEGVAKVSMNGTDAYYLGKLENGAKPDGSTAYAMALGKGYLFLGSAEDVEAALKGAPGATPALAEVIAKHPQSNLLVVVSRAAQAKMQGSSKSNYDMVLAMAQQGIAKELATNEAARPVLEPLQAALPVFLNAALKLQEKGTALMADPQVVHGELKNGEYVVVCQQELKK